MSIIKIVCLALFALIVLILLKSVNKDMSDFALIAVNIGITSFSILTLKPVFDYISQLNQSSQFNGLFETMFKAAGIALLCSFASEICCDAGRQSLASKIELCAKCTLITYSLPIIKRIFDYAKEFIT